MVQLVDEQGEEWPVVYLCRKTGLSGGWKKFAVDHSLVDGDALVFQLIKPTVFKVLFSVDVTNAYLLSVFLKCGAFFCRCL